MKCALELMMTAAVKAEENKEKELLAKQKAEAEKRAYTLKCCEYLGNELEKLANSGETPKVSFYCSWDYHCLIATHKDYADGRLSYNANKEKFDLQLMTDWFAQYCFSVVEKKFHYYTYGFGYCAGYEITITPQMECLQ